MVALSRTSAGPGLSWPLDETSRRFQAENVSDSDFETLRFRAFRTLDGRLSSVSLGKRNGRPVLLLRPGCEQGEPPVSPGWADNPKYYVNLNQIECRTWRRLLDGWTLSEIARDEQVSRAAIRARIQGNAKAQGGMIAKNFWVLLWWRVRRKSKNL